MTNGFSYSSQPVSLVNMDFSAVHFGLFRESQLGFHLKRYTTFESGLPDRVGIAAWDYLKLKRIAQLKPQKVKSIAVKTPLALLQFLR